MTGEISIGCDTQPLNPTIRILHRPDQILKFFEVLMRTELAALGAENYCPPGCHRAARLHQVTSLGLKIIFKCCAEGSVLDGKG